MPRLLDLEVVHVLRRYAAAGVIDAQRGLEAMDDFAASPLSRYPHDLFSCASGPYGIISLRTMLRMSHWPKRCSPPW